MGNFILVILPGLLLVEIKIHISSNPQFKDLTKENFELTSEFSGYR